MDDVFDDMLIDIFPNSPGGRLQAQQRINALGPLGYRSRLSLVTKFVVWSNRLAGGMQDTAPTPPETGCLMLTSVKP